MASYDLKWFLDGRGGNIISISALCSFNSWSFRSLVWFDNLHGVAYCGRIYEVSSGYLRLYLKTWLRFVYGPRLTLLPTKFSCDGILLLHPAKCIHQFSRASDLVYYLFRLLAKDGPWWFLQENKKTEVGDMKLYS